MLFQIGMQLEHLLPARVRATGAAERHSVVRTQSPLGAGQGQVLRSRVHPREGIRFIKPSRTVNLIQDRAEFNTGPARPRRPTLPHEALCGLLTEPPLNSFTSRSVTTSAVDAKQAKKLSNLDFVGIVEGNICRRIALPGYLHAYEGEIYRGKTIQGKK